MNLFTSSLFSSLLTSVSTINKLQSKKSNPSPMKKNQYKISYQLHGSPYTYYKMTDEEPSEMELDQYAWSLVEKI